MSQIIISSAGGPRIFKSFCINFIEEDTSLITWFILFKVISNKHKININFIKLKNKRGKFIYFKSLNNTEPLNLNDFRFHTSTGIPCNEYQITFDILLISHKNIKISHVSNSPTPPRLLKSPTTPLSSYLS